MRIAVAYQDGQIGEHFGHAKMFAIYEYEDADVNHCTKRLIETGDRHGHEAMAELMRDEKVDAVITGNMGGEAADPRPAPDPRRRRRLYGRLRRVLLRLQRLLHGGCLRRLRLRLRQLRQKKRRAQTWVREPSASSARWTMRSSC